MSAEMDTSDIDRRIALVDKELRKQESLLARASPYRSAPRIRLTVEALRAASEYMHESRDCYG